jgi:3-hydroxyanthranilate 3,4-dioxygenase
MALKSPFNLRRWIAANRDLLKPPIGNKNLYADAGDYIVMVVGGPNARKDYHWNETEELFYQVEGDIEVGIQYEGRALTISIKEGDLFLLPARTPHQPRRPAGSVGLVIECKRADREMKDGLLWFCEQCNHKLYEDYFVLYDIEQDFLPRFRHFYGSGALRTCDQCGTVMQADPRFV